MSKAKRKEVPHLEITAGPPQLQLPLGMADGAPPAISVQPDQWGGVFDNEREQARVIRMEPELQASISALLQIRTSSKRVLSLLESKRGTGPSYDRLSRLITQLGDPLKFRDEVARQLLAPIDNARRQARIDRDAAILVCKCFADIVNPDCVQTAYTWNRHVNRTELLYHSDNLNFPECFGGLSLHQDQPRRILLDDTLLPLVKVEPHESKSSFRWREGVHLAWRLRCQWGFSRLVLFLSFRTGSHPSCSIRDMRLSARYLQSWLAESMIDATGEVAVLGLSADAAIQSLRRTFSEPRGSERRRDAFRDAVTSAVALSARNRIFRVHWIHNEALEFEPGQYGDGVESPPMFSLRRSADPLKARYDLVDRSITAQSAYWKTPILLADMSRDRFKSEPRKLLLSLNVNSRDVAGRMLNARSQLAVPILGVTGAALGAINIDVDTGLHGRLGPQHVARVQIISQLYARLHELEDCAELKDVWQDFVHGKIFHEGAGAHRDATELLYEFCKIACRQIEADMGYVLVYDAHIHTFRPLGTCASNEICRRYAQEYYDFTDAGSLFSGRKSKGDGAWNEERRQRMCADSMTGLLIPKARGRSYTVFTTLEPAVIRDTATESVPVRRLAQDLGISSMLGWPFYSDFNAAPAGVLWLWWKSRHDMPESILKERFGLRVEPILKLVAALYELYRFSDGRDTQHS